MSFTPSPGCATRVRAWWAGVIAGEDPAIPAELISKVRVVESVLPMLGRLIGAGSVRTIVDLLPDTDERMAAFLHLLHRWSGAMLAIDTGAAEIEEGDS